MPEFTGERVIPGLVDDDLLNEHLARYRFAARFARGARVLDAGCGAGYGTAEFGDAVSVTAADIAADAVRHARQNFARPGVRFLQASCDALPFAAASFELVTAFEVIEHLERWPQFLEEAARVLKTTGILLVSTPNKSYYAETRAGAGPNPFHCHEFEWEEFQAALYAVFPHVRLWTQNHAEAIVFAPAHPSGAGVDLPGDAAPEHAHFFLAACSRSEIAFNDAYAWLPSSANLLREREHHIVLLEGERARKDAWLEQLRQEHASLQASHEATLAELRQRNEWAARLNQEISARNAVILQLQQELEAQQHSATAEVRRLNQAAAALEAELAARASWARSLEEQLAERTLHVKIQAAQIEELTAHVKWHQQAIASLHEERRRIANSRWLRLGRRLRLGPVVTADPRPHTTTAGEE